MGVRLLRDWDACLASGSAAAALFEVWYRRHLRPAVLSSALGQLLPPERIAAALDRILPAEDLAADARVDLDLLLSPGDRLGYDGRRTLSEIVGATLAAAVDDLVQRLGKDPGAWTWGALHQARPTHPLHALGGREWSTVGPLPRGGSGDTVGSASYDASFRQTAGATFRIVVDVGDWDRSVAMNSPGQSGRPCSRHYEDHFESWACDGSFPLLYSREQVEAGTHLVISLLPPGD